MFYVVLHLYVKLSHIKILWSIPIKIPNSFDMTQSCITTYALSSYWWSNQTCTFVKHCYVNELVEWQPCEYCKLPSNTYWSCNKESFYCPSNRSRLNEFRRRKWYNLGQGFHEETIEYKVGLFWTEMNLLNNSKACQTALIQTISVKMI